MAATIANPAPMINGYSGYFPRTQSQLRPLLADFPTAGGLAVLRALDVRTLAITADSLTPAQQARLAARVAAGEMVPGPPLTGFLVYELPTGEPHLIREYQGGWVVEAALRGDDLTVRAFAAVPDAQVYLADPALSPLRWRVQVVGADGGDAV